MTASPRSVQLRTLALQYTPIRCRACGARAGEWFHVFETDRPGDLCVAHGGREPWIILDLCDQGRRLYQSQWPRDALGAPLAKCLLYGKIAKRGFGWLAANVT